MAGNQSMGQPSNLPDPTPGADEQAQQNADIIANIPKGMFRPNVNAPTATPAPEAAPTPPTLGLSAAPNSAPNPASAAADAAFANLSPEEQNYIQNLQGSNDSRKLSAEKLQTQIQNSYLAPQTGSPLSLLQNGMLSFAVTDTERRAALDSIVGKENVQEETDPKNGKSVFSVRTDPFDPLFHNVNPGWGQESPFNYMGETVANHARQIFEGGIQTGVIAASDGAALIGGGAAIAAHETANLVAQNILGIPRDPNRSRMTEDAIAGAAGSVFQGATNYVSSIAALGNVRQAYQDALAGEAPALQIPAELDNIEKDLMNMGARGFQAGVTDADGNTMYFMTHQYLASSNNPIIKKIGERWGADPAMNAMQIDQGNAIVSTANKLLKNVGLKSEFGAAIDPEAHIGLQENVNDYVQAFFKKEGEAIGEYRRMANVKLAGKSQNAPATDQIAGDLLSRLNITRQGNQLLNADTGEELTMDEFANMVGVPGKTTFKSSGAKSVTYDNRVVQFKQTFDSLVEDMYNGKGLTIDQFDSYLNKFKRIQDSSKAAGAVDQFSRMRGINGNILSNIREDYNNAIYEALPENMQPKFSEVRGNYGTLASGLNRMGHILEQPMGQEAFVKSIFSKGKEGLGDMMAMKAMLAQKPELWDGIRDMALSQSIEDATEGGAKNFGSAAVAKMQASLFKRYGREGAQEILGPAAQDIRTLAKYSDILNSSNFNNMSQANQRDIVANAMLGIFGFKYKALNAVTSIVKTMDPTNRLRDYMTKNGTDEILGLATDANKTRAQLIIRSIMQGAKPVASGTKNVLGTVYGAYARGNAQNIGAKIINKLTPGNPFPALETRRPENVPPEE